MENQQPHERIVSDTSSDEHVGKMLPKIIDSIEVGLYVSDFDTGEILFANRKLRAHVSQMFKVEDLAGRYCWEFFNHAGEGRCPFCPQKHLVDPEGNLLQAYEWEHYFPDLKAWVKAISQAIDWPNGRLANLVTFYDITESKRMQEKLADLAFVDHLLQLKNGIRLELDVWNAPVPPTLIILDIVSLQKVNDAYGRKIGDLLLKAVRDYVQQQFPGVNLYRTGGDEFCLVNHLSKPDATALADTLLQRFGEPWIFEDNSGSRKHIFANASVGVILGDYLHNGELLNLIERTLNEAKANGRVIIYDEETDKKFKQRLALELSLKKSVREDMSGFEVYYQPIVNPVTGLWCGLEALCRWNSTELGRVPPLVFIPEAERFALIGRIGLWVLETAVSQCKEWKLDEVPGFALHVNLSAVQFSDEALSSNILKILGDCSYPGERLCVEITESTQFTFTDLSLYMLTELRAHHVLTALDDFGTGYANFGNLKSLPIDIIKIEKNFTEDIESNSYHLYLLQAMAEIAHRAGMRLIAEGVENDEQKSILLQSDADYLQGYLFSEPLPPDLLETWLHRFRA